MADSFDQDTELDVAELGSGGGEGELAKSQGVGTYLAELSWPLTASTNALSCTYPTAPGCSVWPVRRAHPLCCLFPLAGACCTDCQLHKTMLGAVSQIRSVDIKFG